MVGTVFRDGCSCVKDKSASSWLVEEQKMWRVLEIRDATDGRCSALSGCK